MAAGIVAESHDAGIAAIAGGAIDLSAIGWTMLA
jgi:hypothetical protein